jgi:hypothetical protein
MTLGTTDPLESVTTPVMVAKVDWAGNCTAQRTAPHASKTPDEREYRIAFTSSIKHIGGNLNCQAKYLYVTRQRFV